MKPTGRTLEYLKDRGYIADVVERHIPGSFITKDFFGFADVLFVTPGEQGVTAVQVTSKENVAARLAKIRAEERARIWMETGNRIEIHGWPKEHTKEDRQIQMPRIVRLKLRPISSTKRCTRNSSGCTGTSRNPQIAGEKQIKPSRDSTQT